MKIIFISGPTGSGKTTLSQKLSKEFINSTILSTDDYYKTGLISKLLSRLVRNYFDKSISFNYKLLFRDLTFICKNNKITHKYKYNFKKKTIKKFLFKKNNVELIIVEGIFVNDFIRKFNIKNLFFIEINIDKKSCMKRAIKRDMEERGKSHKFAENDFLNSWNIFYRKRQNPNINKFIYSSNTEISSLFNKIINYKT